MKHIRNIQKAWLRLGELIELRARAVKNHQQRSHIELEMVKVRKEILAFENRQERRAA